MVFGALYKEKIRRQARAEAIKESDKAWREWLQRKAEAERNGEPFDEPNPAERPEKPRRRFPFGRR